MIVTKRQLETLLPTLSDQKKYELKEAKEKRSLTANAFYWSMLGKIGQAMKMSTSILHNQYLRELGLPERIEDRLVTLSLPDTDTAERMVIESTTYHAKPTSQVREGRDGVMYRTYIMLRGSHTYNVKEFSALIDLVIQDANSLGIETITTEQNSRMAR